MRRDGEWRSRIMPAVLTAVLLLAPLVVARHVHASHSASSSSSSCLLCAAAEHGVSDVPVVAGVAAAVATVRPATPAVPVEIVVRPLAASPSRGPPACATPSPH